MEKADENVGIAFDNMELVMEDLPMMHLIIEPLKLMFNEHYQHLEQKALKRHFKQERVKEIQKEEDLKTRAEKKVDVDMENGNKINESTDKVTIERPSVFKFKLEEK